jgi:phosphate/phosphite/phosphonate ABC transporter binding protein
VRTHTGKIKGKYPYMSPEQCRGDPLDRRTDLFSLGIVMHELLTGRRLFQRSTDLMTLKAITEEEVPSPADSQPGVPEAICSVIMRALQRDPAQRYASAAEMGSALRSALAELGARTSRQTVSTYLETNHDELLASRAQAMREVLSLQPATGSPPLVGGLDGGTGGSASAVSPSAVTASRRAPPRKRRSGPLRILALAAVVILLGAAAGLVVRHVRSSAEPSGPPLYFGLPPSFPEEVAQREWEPLLAHLGQRLGRPIRLVVPDSYRALRKMLLQGKLHFANLPALQFVIARHRARELRPLVTHTIDGALTYQSYIVARNDNALASVEDLEGRTFCYSDPGSTSGYLLPRHLLRERGLDPERLFASAKFSGNHVSVMKDVLAGRCDAGAVYSLAMLSGRSLGISNSQLQVLAVAGKIPYDAICPSPSLPDKLQDALRRALLELDLQELLGRRVLGPAFRIDGFVEAHPEAFAEIEAAARAEDLLR